MEHTELDRLLSSAFHGGEQVRRELRLSDEDAQLLRSRYPVTVRPMGEQWYEVTFSSVHTEGVSQIGA